MVDRRTFLRSAAAAGGGFVFCGCALAGRTTLAAASFSQARGGRRRVVIGGKPVRTVDMHCHAYVHDVWPLIKDRPEVAGSDLAERAETPMAIDGTTIAARLREMDRQGIDVHAVSLQSSQHHYWAEPDLAARIVSIQNEKLAEVCATHPDRFVALGGVSIQHPALAVEQMAHAVKTLGMRGFMIGGRVNDDEISAPKFDPFWKQAEALGIVIFVHPSGFPQAGNRFAGHGSLRNTLGNPLETTVALSHMIFEGFLDRFPGVRILAAHGGGYLPSYIGRSDKCHSWNEECQAMRRKPSDYLKGPQLYFDSLVYSPENLRHLVSTVGASQVVIGTDFAYDMASTTPVDDILGTPDLTPEDRIAMLGGNAATLLKLDPA